MQHYISYDRVMISRRQRSIPKRHSEIPAILACMLIGLVIGLTFGGGVQFAMVIRRLLGI